MIAISSRLCLFGVTLRRRLGIGPGTQPAAISNGVIHPKEVDPAIEKPAPKVGDPNVVPPPGTSGALPRPAKMTARFVRLVPASKWTGNARPEPSVAILAVCPEHSFRLRGHPNGPGQCFGTPQSRRKITMRPSARLLFATAFIGGLDNAALAGSRASLADLLGQGYEVKATSTLPLVDS